MQAEPFETKFESIKNEIIFKMKIEEIDSKPVLLIQLYHEETFQKYSMFIDHEYIKKNNFVNIFDSPEQLFVYLRSNFDSLTINSLQKINFEIMMHTSKKSSFTIVTQKQQMKENDLILMRLAKIQKCMALTKKQVKNQQNFQAKIQNLADQNIALKARIAKIQQSNHLDIINHQFNDLWSKNTKLKQQLCLVRQQFTKLKRQNQTERQGFTTLVARIADEIIDQKLERIYSKLAKNNYLAKHIGFELINHRALTQHNWYNTNRIQNQQDLTQTIINSIKSHLDQLNSQFIKPHNKNYQRASFKHSLVNEEEIRKARIQKAPTTGVKGFFGEDWGTFVTARPIDHPMVYHFQLISITNKEIFIGIGSQTVLNKAIPTSPDFMNYYYKDGQFCVDGAVQEKGQNGGGNQSHLQMKVDPCRLMVQWWVDANKVAQALIPEHMSKTSLFAVIRLFHPKDKVLMWTQ